MRSAEFYVAVVALSVVIGSAPGLRGEERVDFGRDVRPILSEICFQCHGPDEKAREADLRLDTREGLFGDRDDIVAFVANKPEASEAIRRITSDDPDEKMPPPAAKRQLTAKQIEVLRRWVQEGARWQQHWAFEKPSRPILPSVQKTNWPHNAIDWFVLARQERDGLTPSTEASRERLIRRVTFDLTGIPPTIEDIETFLQDDSPHAYEKVVDRLLTSPRYGERMAWDWLDAARYADSNGFQGDPERTMWPWRDWVVRALNDNMPFDQFTIQQLAGDLLPGATVDQIVATGFNRNHMHNGEGGRIAEETRVENVMDRAETTATVWLGATMTCCRCHDHKFDPFLQREYYQFFAFFNNTSENGGGRSGQNAPAVGAPSPLQADRFAELAETIDMTAKDLAQHEAAKVSDLPGEIAALLKKSPVQRSPAELQKLIDFFKDRDAALADLLGKLKAAVDAKNALNKSLPRVMVMDNLAQPRDTFIFTRGLYNKPTAKVTANVPSVLPPLPNEAPRNRLGLARWLVDPQHPLTARVTVNRYWQMFFGTGLVKTPEDFGVQGERPSHPELLDWLATEFVRSGWDLKRLHRLIVTSSTYRQSAKITSELLSRDPQNRLLARGPRSRMPAWMIRDHALAASGLFVEQLGGASVKPYQPTGVWAEATFGKKRYQQDTGDKLYRRSLYIFWRRIIGPTMFFDSAKRQTCEVRQSRTNTPLHALLTMNGTTYVEAARAMAQRLLESNEQSTATRVGLAFRLVTSRRPKTEETELLVRRCEKLRQQFAASPGEAAKLLTVGDSPRNEKLDAAEHAAYTGICMLLLNLDESLSK